ncbi:unnamed protein product [Thelazia callipaeda]|uniref:RRM domain-containing protein n=1 Tax=Thelazia callipaeda TaxID=103827 RepID=A0A0N5CVB0_THECL|nr:unnamed protein product [Thelazia callipaeda]
MSMNDMVSLTLDEIIARSGQKFRAKRTGFTKRNSFRSGLRRRSKGNFRAKNLKQESNVCIVNISNLGPMVTTSDLQELFSGFPYEDVAVQYEPNGIPSGTAVVIFKKFEDGMKLKRQFSGVRLDGKVMEIFVLTKNDFLRGVSQGRIKKRVTRGSTRFGISNFQTKKRVGNFVKSRTLAARKNRPTSEELDRELDAYMRGSKHPKVSAP